MKRFFAGLLVCILVFNLFGNVHTVEAVDNMAIVNIAKNEIGVSGQPNKYTYWNGSIGGTYAYAWCHAFVSWCAEQAGAGDLIPKTASCYNGVQWFKNQGLWKDRSSGYTPEAGDIIYFDWDTDGDWNHVGIVNYVSDGRVYIIDGNSGGYPGAVKEHNYSLNDVEIAGYGTPQYDEAEEEETQLILGEPVDLGTGFYAYIKNSSTNRYISNVNGNVEGEVLDGSDSNIWRFDRQSDGTYKIISALDNGAMDVTDYGNAGSGTNVQMNTSWDTTAQKFYIYEMYGAYYIKPICCDLFLDMDLNEPNNVAVWGMGVDWPTQKFEIMKVNSDDVGVHKYVPTVTKEATCTEEGTRTYTCSVCQDSYTETIEMTSHQYSDEWTIDVEATNTSEGSKSHHCLNCDAKTDITVIPKLEETLSNPFEDVYEWHFFYNPVLWAYNDGIANGKSSTLFAPYDISTRGDVVTFLWRAAGSPEPSSTVCPFVDVPEYAYYYKAILWAVESGITNGTSATTFEPNAQCTRAQVVTFLWRVAGSEEPESAASTFGDVPDYAYYLKAVLWAVENGITSGTSATTFAPDAACTRGEIVTFLYRHYN